MATPQASQDGESRQRRSSLASQKSSLSFRELSTRKKWTLVLMAFANFAACTCFSLLAPFFPQEAAKKGASQTIIGMIFSCFELWIFISAPFYGNYLTRIGSKFLFASGLFVCGGCSILFGVLDHSPAGTSFIVLCFLVRSVEALGAAAFTTASFAIIANDFPDHVSTIFGILETFSGLGLMVGPPIGGALYQVGGYGLPFWSMGSLLIGCASFTAIFMHAGPDSVKRDRGSVLTLLTSPLVVVALLTVVSGSFCLGFLDPTLSDFLGQFHLDTVYIGLVFIVGPFVYAVTAPLWGLLSDWGLSFPIVTLSNVLASFSFLLIGPSPLLPFLPHTLWLVIVSLALAGLSIGGALVCALKCVLLGARSVGFEDNLDTFGLVSGLFNSAFSFGTFIGPTVGSIITEHYGFQWASTITAFNFAFAAVLFATYLLLAKGAQACCGKNQGQSSARLISSNSVAYQSLSQTPIISSTTNIPPDNS